MAGWAATVLTLLLPLDGVQSCSTLHRRNIAAKPDVVNKPSSWWQAVLAQIGSATSCHLAFTQQLLVNELTIASMQMLQLSSCLSPLHWAQTLSPTSTSPQRFAAESAPANVATAHDTLRCAAVWMVQRSKWSFHGT